MQRSVLIVLVLLSAAPLAGAIDPFRDQLCVNQEACYGAGSCVADAGCVPRGCEPLASCSGEIGPDSTSCAFNATISGATCASHLGVALGGAEGTRLAARATASNGSVDAHKLENTWSAPGAEAELALAGLDFGGLYVYLYRSDILTEGPRGGLYGQVAPSANHTWTQIGVTGGHYGGPLSGEDFAIAVELLDLMPESCWVRSPSGVAPELACPSLAPYYP